MNLVSHEGSIDGLLYQYEEKKISRGSTEASARASKAVGLQSGEAIKCCAILSY